MTIFNVTIKITSKITKMEIKLGGVCYAVV